MASGFSFHFLKYYTNLAMLAFLPPEKRSLGQGNIFAPVCHSVHGGGKYLGRYPSWQVHTPPQVGIPPLGRYTPLAGTPPRQVPPLAGTPLAGTPPGQVHPPGRYIPLARYTPGQVHPPGRYTPLGRYTSIAGTQPPPPEQCMLGDTGNKRPVRILLECILVY